MDKINTRHEHDLSLLNVILTNQKGMYHAGMNNSVILNLLLKSLHRDE